MIYVANDSHELLTSLNLAEKISIDMTCGRGNDTLFLSSISKLVYAFDIQEEAIQSTQALLKENHRDNVILIHANHEFVDQYVSEEIGAVIYNLGYLPSGNKDIKTSALSTIESLKKVLKMLMVNGKVVIVLYQKHEANESMEVKHFCSNLDCHHFDVLQISVLNKELAPFIIQITKIK